MQKLTPKPQREVGGTGGHWEEEKGKRKNLLKFVVKPECEVGRIVLPSSRPPVFPPSRSSFIMIIGNMWAQSWDHLAQELLPFPNRTKRDVTAALIDQVLHIYLFKLISLSRLF